MKIIFVVNTTGLTGGIKVIFELSNRLSRMGHEVSIIHILRIKRGFTGLLIALLKKLKYLLLELFKINTVAWFRLDGNIRVMRKISLRGLRANAIIATANETADWVNALPAANGEKFYFVQGYESWTRDVSLVDLTYKMPLKKIVVSSWLAQVLKDKFGESVVGVVTNGVDIRYLSCSGSRRSERKKILMLYHVLPKKGSKEGLEVLESIKRKYPNIEIAMFGAYKLESVIPPYIKYHLRPDKDGKLKELYCSSDIYLLPSLEEGFAMTPMEAMAAGCAVVATDVGAVRDYSVPDKTVIIVPPGNIVAMVSAIESLLNDEHKLTAMGSAGQEYIKKFTWESSAEKFANILQSTCPAEKEKS